MGDAIALNVSPMPGNPLVIGHAPRARTISAAFLNSYNDHFNEEGHGIFAKIYKDYPVEYFWGLITLAKVMKIEIGGPHEFDRPSTGGGAGSAGAYRWTTCAQDVGAVSRSSCRG